MDVSSGLPASSAASSRAESSRSTAAPSRPLVLSPPPLTSAGSQTSAAEHKGKTTVLVSKSGAAPIIVGLLPSSGVGRAATATVLSVSRASSLQVVSKSTGAQPAVAKAMSSVMSAASQSNRSFAQATPTSMPTTYFSSKPIILSRSPAISKDRDPPPPALPPSLLAVGQGAGKPKSFIALMTAETTANKKQSSTTKKAQTPRSSKSQSPRTTKLTPPSNESTPQQQPTRSSQRSVKRPKTYDEELAELEMMAKTVKKTKGGVSRSTSKKSNRQKSSAAAKDLGRWKPTDDLMLISAIQQTNDLGAVHAGVKFSCRFTLKEVQERWYALLYDPLISKMAVEAMKALPPGGVTVALNNALWSVEEEAVLSRTPSSDPGHLEMFQGLLRDHPSVFHACRTPTSIHHHWVLMGHYGLLNNQKIDLIPPGDTVVNFADAEDQLNDSELARPRDVREEALEQELMAADHCAKKEIIKLEEELPKWRTIINTGAPPDFGPGVYVILKGKVVEFVMTSESVTLGRNSTSGLVDFNLSLEAPAFKISRRQATIRVSSDGDVILHNEGKRPVYLGGKALVTGKSAKLQHQQVLEVATMSFLVLLNSALVNSTKTSFV